MKREIFAYIDGHEADVVDFLSHLIELKPINLGTRGSGREGAAQQWLRRRLKEMGFDKVDSWAVDEKGERQNVVATIDGVGGGNSLIYNGHVDVVPVHDYQRDRWTVDPWKATIKHGTVYGRGAGDMLAGLAAMFWAGKAIIDQGVKLKGSLHIESVPGEESGESYLGTGACIERGYKTSFAVVGEPTTGEIQPVTCGTFMFDMTVPGKDIHTSMKNLTIYPQRHGIPHGSDVGVDAIAKAVKYITAFQELERNWGFRWRHRVLGGGGQPVPVDREGVGAFTITPALIEGGTYFGSLAGYCKMTVQVYYPPWVSPREVWKEIKQVIQSVSYSDDWLRDHPPVLRVDKAIEGNDEYFMWEANEVPMEHPGCAALASAWKQATGKDAVFAGFKAVCDVTILGKAGIPAIVFGPGDLSSGVHGPDERVPIKALMDCCKAYAAMAVDWCEPA